MVPSCPFEPNLPGIGYCWILGGIAVGFIGIVLWVTNMRKIDLVIQSKCPNSLSFDADEGPTNDDRTSWAEAALIVFAQRTGLVKETLGDEEAPFLIISDLLADVAHWCDRNHVDLPAALAHAARHYQAETGGTGRQFSS